jgi:allantoin racemase
MQLLLVNSNSTSAVTERMVATANTVAATQTTVTGMTATGAAVIRSHLEFAEAAVQTVRVLQQHARGHDAAIIGCFGDPGLKAARQTLDIPVVGLTEAAMLMAHPLGGRYSVICFGRHNAIHMVDLARSYGLHSRLASVRIPEVSYREILADPNQAFDACVAAGQRALVDDGADVLILGGGPVAGMARPVADILDVPVLDSIVCATKLAESLAACGYKTSRYGLYQSVE